MVDRAVGLLLSTTVNCQVPLTASICHKLQSYGLSIIGNKRERPPYTARLWFGNLCYSTRSGVESKGLGKYLKVPRGTHLSD